MLDGWSRSRRGTACKALVALIGVTGCLAAVAYAASAPNRAPGPPSQGSGTVVVSSTGLLAPTAARASSGSSKRGPRPARPRISAHPPKSTLQNSAAFRLSTKQPKVGFECKLDSGKWRGCKPKLSFTGLTLGTHKFYARARSGRRHSATSTYTWTQAQPVSFAIAQQPGLGALYPGAPAQSIPLLLTNPNPESIFVTALRASVSGEGPNCPSAENLELLPAAIPAAAPIQVPANGSVSLPAQGPSPTISMRDLPVSQDACQGTQFTFALSGEAHG